MRHAIALARDAHRWPDDEDRPLSARGIARARRAALGLKAICARPTRVFASPLLRATQTAAILTRSAGWPRATECRQLLPGVPPRELVAFLGRSREERVAVVGHEPGLGNLLTACLPGSVTTAAFSLRKMGVALLEFPGVARLGGGELQWFLPPRILRALR